MDNNFDSSLKRLQEITRLLEENKCPLEEAIKLFEEGVRLTVNCEKFLSEAKQKIEYLESGEDHVN